MRPISWSRRIGVALGAVALGAAAVFASQAPDRGVPAPPSPGAGASADGPAAGAGSPMPVTSPSPAAAPDKRRPVIVISAPAPGKSVTTEQVTVSGRTEPLASVIVTNTTNGDGSTDDAASTGAFAATVGLALGTNEIVVASSDAAGNRGSARLRIVRSPSLAAVTVTVSVDTLRRSRLPGTLDILATVIDDQGQPVNGPEVIFSISIPGLATTTYRAPIVSGGAAWTGVDVPRDGTAKGRGRVTAQVTLEGGQVLSGNASFSVR